MRIKGLLALVAAAVTLVVASPEAAQAFDHNRANPPAGWVGVRHVRHWVYYPRYQHYYLANGTTDPYAYRYQTNGYYPYYNSGYWKPRNCVPLKRAHFAHPKYYQAWSEQEALQPHKMACQTSRRASSSSVVRITSLPASWRVQVTFI